MEDWLSIEDILRRLSGEGYRITRRTFLYYVQLGLLPKGKRVGQKHGGVKFYYPGWTLTRLKEILDLKQQGLKLREIQQRLSRPTEGPEAPEELLLSGFSEREKLERCTGCGICGGICPVYEELDQPPWRLIQALRDRREDLLTESNTPWICVGCYLCEERCPEEVPIVSFLRFLKRKALREKRAGVSQAREWSQLFWELLEERGRSFDFGAVHAYQIRMVTSGEERRLLLKLPLRDGEIQVSAPEAIQHLAGFKRMLARAREIS